MDTETIPDDDPHAGRRLAAASILAGWDRVSVRAYPGYWTVAGIDLRGKCWAGHTAEQDDTDDPCDVAQRLLNQSADHWANFDASRAMTFDGGLVTYTQSRPMVGYVEGVGHDSEDQSSIQENRETVSAVAEGQSTESLPDDDAVDSAVETPIPSLPADAASPSAVDTQSAVAEGEEDRTTSEDDGDLDGVSPSLGAADEPLSPPHDFVGGVTLTADELNALRSTLQAEIAAHAEALIAQHKPPLERQIELVHKLEMKLATADELAELQGFQAWESWTLRVQSYALDLREEVLAADEETLRLFEVDEGWPEPPG